MPLQEFAPSSASSGTPTSFSSGSIIFAGNAGVLSQNNSALFWDNTNVSLKVGLARMFANGTAATSRNQFWGESAGNYTLTGTENIGVGYLALNAVTGGVSPAGSFNTAFGSFALQLNTTGYKNCAFGRATLDSNVSGYHNMAIGYGTLHANDTGFQNTAVGMESCHDGTGFSDNTGIGAFALRSATGSYNTCVGSQAGQNIVAGARNTGVGLNALYATASGNDNAALGYGAGVTNTGSGNIFVGQGADCSAGLSNVTVIGTGTTGTTSNTFILGNSSQSIGVNTLTPDRRFEILDASNPQLRLSQADNSVYTDFQITSGGITDLISTGRIFRFSKSSAGSIVDLEFINSDNTSGSSATRLFLQTGGGSGGDAYTLYEVSGATDWATGIDNSDSDAFTISAGSAPGSSNCLKITTAGLVTIPANDFYTQRSSAGGSVVSATENTDNSNASSHATFFPKVGGSSAGDPRILYEISGVTNWVEGVDNSDSDKFKISASNALGTSDRFVIETGGTVWFGTHSAIGAETVTGYITIKDAAGNTRKLAVVS